MTSAERLAPLAEADPAIFADVSIVLTDIDDTLTSAGRLTADAYVALEALDHAGFQVIPLTGRPAGWCDLIARQWPVAGVVGENGALAYRYDRSGRRMTRLYQFSESRLLENQAKLRVIGERILTEIPGAAIAADQPFRLADLAIDFSEDVAPLSIDDVQRIVELFRAHGATAKVSSIHVNGWFGDYDKLSMAKTLLAEGFGLALSSKNAVFVGDSPNDEPLFEAIPLSIGVANVLAFSEMLKHPPRFVTRASGGAGFVELAQKLLMAQTQV